MVPGDAAPPTTMTLRGAVGVLTLDGPPVNALTLDLVGSLRRSLRDALDAGARALVVRSANDRHFSAGGDIRLLARASDEEFAGYIAEVRAAIEDLAAAPVPTIGAVDGSALGGGLELALACDLRCLGPRACLGFPEIRLGLLPGAGGSQRMAALVGRERALDLMLSGRSLARDEALAWGLGTAADRAEEAAVRLAERIAENSAAAGAAIVRCVDAALDPRRDGMQVELDEISALFRNPDTTCRIAAFRGE